ncbi:hypothetical protein HanIR_Chr04g0201041 [Helianthus annuus]|nr:hypothetical protein HanIR_Chr04g0201041 [Helianthus annuus]
MASKRAAMAANWAVIGSPTSPRLQFQIEVAINFPTMEPIDRYRKSKVVN